MLFAVLRVSFVQKQSTVCSHNPFQFGTHGICLSITSQSIKSLPRIKCELGRFEREKLFIPKNTINLEKFRVEATKSFAKSFNYFFL